MKFTLGVFSGAIKALHPKLLPDSVGVDSRNQKPGRGDFRPWRNPQQVASVPTGRMSIYRFGRDVKSDANYWFSWNTRVHAIRGFDIDDTTERTYFTGSGTPKWTDNTIALAGAPYPTATRPLGVPAPVTAPVVSSNADGTSTQTEDRGYAYTYVNTKGDESAPSPSSLLTCKTDDTATLASIAPPPAGYDIDRIRHYRAESGASGSAEFFFLRETTASTSSTTDDLRALQEVMATDGWLPPPDDLSYLTPMWNGMAAGISGNGVQVCEPNKLYAWKLANQFVPPDAKPVALGAWEQNLLVLTTGRPSIMTGTTPESLDLAPMEGQACCAPAGVVSFPHGVGWPCEDGLVYYGEAGAKLLTGGLLTRDDWQAMNPSGIVAGIYEGAYLGFYTDATGARRGFLLDPLNPRALLYLDKGYDALFFDKLQDALFVYDGGTGDVLKWDAGAALMTAKFVSKVFVTKPMNAKWVKVTGGVFPVTIAVDAGPFTADALAALVAYNPARLSANGDRVRYTVVVADQNPAPVPGGFLATEWQATLQGAGDVQLVEFATNPREFV